MMTEYDECETCSMPLRDESVGKLCPFGGNHPAPVPAPGPCGSWRVLEFVEGYEYQKRWCSRTDGPCPYPGAPKSKTSERDCQSSPSVPAP